MFSCKRCGYEANYKANLKNHLQRLTPCDAKLNDIDCTILLEEISKPRSANFNCDKCNKTFSHASGKYRHQRTCNSFANKTDDLQYQIEELKKQLQAITNNNFLAAAAPIVNNGHITTNNNQTVNVNITNNIHNLQNSDYSDISIVEIRDHINSYPHPSDFVTNIINLFHFNRDFPRNHNIRIINEFEAEVFENGKWVTKPTTDVLKSLVALIYETITIKLSHISEFERQFRYLSSTSQFKKNLDFIKNVRNGEIEINHQSPWKSIISQMKTSSDKIIFR